MNNKLILLVFVLLGFRLNAQFTGGAGDGYASDKKSFRSVGLENQKNTVFIYPTILKSNEIIHNSLGFEGNLHLINILGETQIVPFVAGLGHQIPSGLAIGTYRVIAIKNEYYYQSTLLVYE